MIAGEANLVPPTVSVSAAMNNRPIRLTTDANVSTAEPASLDLQVEHSDELGRALARIYRRILAFGDPAVEQRSSLVARRIHRCRNQRHRGRVWEPRIAAQAAWQRPTVKAATAPRGREGR